MTLFDKLFWGFNRRLFAVLMKKNFNLQYAENCEALPNSAFIMVANHANFFDPWIVAHPSQRPVSIMMNEEGFKAKPITRWYLKHIGAFPKKKGGTDVRSMKTALKRLKEGNPLLIFPEGQTSWDGETQPIYSGIEKLILKSNLPLVMVNLSGNFISRPWWSEETRKGAVIVSRKVLPVEKLATMEPETLREEITNYIYNNDCKNERISQIEFTSEAPANGLNRLLWFCPECKSRVNLVVSSASVTCTKCNHIFTINPNLTINNTDKISTIHDWVAIQKEIVEDDIESDKGVHLTTLGIRLVDVDYSGRIITLDTGKLTLSKEEIIYAGEHGTLTFPVSEISQPVFQQKDIIQFDHGKSTVRFYIDNDSLYKWLTYLRYLTGYKEAEMRRYY